MRNLPPYRYRKFPNTDSRFRIEWGRYASVAGRGVDRCWAAVLGLCFPYSCPGCGELQKYADVLCETCARILPRIHAPYCSICGSPLKPNWQVKICPDCRERRPRVTRIRSGFLYEGIVTQLIREVKFARRARALEFFAGELYSKWMPDFPRSITAIVPVPLHPSREWERTFNQSVLLARELSKLSGIPVVELLRRQKRTLPQTSLSGQARRRNLNGVFRFRSSTPDLPRSVILVDDVVTTGATLEACAGTLRKAGVRKVYCLTIARAVLKT
jgi:ComF family protein